MPFIRLCLAAAFLLGASVTVSAEQSTEQTKWRAGGWLKKCKVLGTRDTTRAGWDRGLCMGFLLGVRQTHQMMVFGSSAKPLWCEPEHTTLGNMQDVWVKHMEEHPEDWNEHPWGIFVQAMRKGLPMQGIAVETPHHAIIIPARAPFVFSDSPAPAPADT